MRRDRIYSVRFPEVERDAKDAVWQVLCRHFFQRYVKAGDVVLDLGAGFGEFLRHIQCRHRIAVDIEEISGRHLPTGTDEIIVPSQELSTRVASDSVDIVFCSNFFEHLPDKAALETTLAEIRTVLRPGGRLLVLQPNIRLVGGAYWNFIDHHVALTDRSLAEACEISGFTVQEVIPRFLPYTTRSRLPQKPWLVRAYLLCRPAWWFLGGQTWLVAVKAA